MRKSFFWFALGKYLKLIARPPFYIKYLKPTPGPSREGNMKEPRLDLKEGNMK